MNGFVVEIVVNKNENRTNYQIIKQKHQINNILPLQLDSNCCIDATGKRGKSITPTLNRITAKICLPSNALCNCYWMQPYLLPIWMGRRILCHCLVYRHSVPLSFSKCSFFKISPFIYLCIVHPPIVSLAIFLSPFCSDILFSVLCIRRACVCPYVCVCLFSLNFAILLVESFKRKMKGIYWYWFVRVCLDSVSCHSHSTYTHNAIRQFWRGVE